MFKTTTRQVRVLLTLESTVISNHRRRKIASFTELMFAVWYLLISVIEERYRQVKGLKTKKLKRKKGKTSCFILRNILTVISYLIYVSKHTSLYCFCKKAPSQILEKVLNKALDKAKYLPQLQMRLFKKATMPDTNPFFTSLYWKTILPKTAQPGKVQQSL